MNQNFGSFFQWTPSWIVCLALLAVLLLATEIGYRMAARHRPRVADAKDLTANLDTIQAAVLGLLGLILAFTYAFVAERADARKQAVIQEANAIGTAYLRAGLMPAPEGPQLRGLLREYAASRIVSHEAGGNRAKLLAEIKRSERIQTQIWPLVERIEARHPPTVLDALLLQSLNEVIDMNTVRLAAGRDHVPVAVLSMLFFIAAVAMAFCGYGAGVAGRRNIGRTTMLSLLIVAVIFVILDLDRPRTGLIRVSEQSLYDVQHEMDAADAARGSQSAPPAGIR